MTLAFSAPYKCSYLFTYLLTYHYGATKHTEKYLKNGVGT